MSDAYARAVSQFRALRAEHYIANNVAAMEAEQLGSTFGTSEIEESFEQQKKALSTWDRKAELDQGELAAQKRWKAIVNRSHGAGQWSKGQEYVRLWQDGIRPTYLPAISNLQAPAGQPQLDPMGLILETSSKGA